MSVFLHKNSGALENKEKFQESQISTNELIIICNRYKVRVFL